MTKEENLVKQLFIGKVSAILGFDKTLELLKEANDISKKYKHNIVGNTVLVERCYQIDFGNHLRCKIKVTDNGIEVVGVINGWGDGIPLDEVVVVELQ